jgi:putative flavoprotein involved in K+ transport
MKAGLTCDVVIIGAGQAGLGVSYYLTRGGAPHRVLERGRIGETWRTQRWDSFMMNSPNFMTVMPDAPYRGLEPEGFFSLREMTDEFEAFARRNRLPVESGIAVSAVDQLDGSDVYRLTTDKEVILTRNVVLATGCATRPRIPAIAARLPASLKQLHTADYRNSNLLPKGAVLVVGCGASGTQIVEDLLESGRTVYFATSRAPRQPRRYRGRDISCWNHDSGIMDAGIETLTDPTTRFAPHGMLSGTHGGRSLNLRSLAANGAILLGRMTDCIDGCMMFAADLRSNIEFSDKTADAARQRVDAYIAVNGINAPDDVPEWEEIVSPDLPDPPIRSLDPISMGISTVIWCTGFGGDFRWIHLPVFDRNGWPEHVGGITRLPGVYFTGLLWLSVRGSHLVRDIAKDAQRVANHIQARCAQR